MEQTKFLPLGSIVRLNGGVKKVVIIARAVATKLGEETKYLEYETCRTKPAYRPWTLEGSGLWDMK
jgi:hypothetical protein